jgi:hypothetical protein
MEVSVMSNWRSFRIFYAILSGIGFSFIAANGAFAAGQQLQVFTASANTPNGQAVVQGLVTFNPNTTTIEYCLATPFGAEKQCAISNIGSAIGSTTGMTLIGRVDAGSSGSIPTSGGQSGQLTPIVHPAFYVASVKTIDQSFQGYVVVALSVTTDSSGLLQPVISGAF